MTRLRMNASPDKARGPQFSSRDHAIVALGLLTWALFACSFVALLANDILDLAGACR